MGAEISDDNFIGTDEDGTSYYADDDGNITAVSSDGEVTSGSRDEGPSGSEDSWTDYGGYEYDTDTDTNFTFDDNGNLINADTGEAATATVGGKTGASAVTGVFDANGKTVAGYSYNPSTGKYQDARGRSYTDKQLDETLHNLYGNAGAQYASNIAATFGNALNTNVTKAVAEGGDSVRQTIANAAAGDPAAQVLAAAVTGTLPTNVTDGRVIQTLQDMQNRMANGQSLKEAFYGAADKTGLTANEKMNNALKDAVLNVALTYGTMGLGLGLGALEKGAGLTRVRNVMNALGVGGKYAGAKGAATLNTAAKLLNDADKTLTVASLTSQLMGIGIAANDAKEMAEAWARDNKPANPYDTPNQAAQELAAKKPVEEAPAPTVTKTAEKTPTASKPVDNSKAATLTFHPTTTLPTGEGFNTGIDWLEVERGRDKTPEIGEKTNLSGWDEDSSGSDNLESTTQSAPTGGVGQETFSNTNDPRKGWGLGEEDPNRANYDNDKWNRGMEDVSTDVVSDAKCKEFISRTFSNDPVLIKAVSIMKKNK